MNWITYDITWLFAAGDNSFKNKGGVGEILAERNIERRGAGKLSL